MLDNFLKRLATRTVASAQETRLHWKKQMF